MKLVFLCTHCKKSNYLKSNALSRSELHREYGDIVTAKCEHCPNVNKLELTDIRAEANPLYERLSALVLLLSGGAVVFIVFSLWAVGLMPTLGGVAALATTFIGLPVTVTYLIIRQEDDKVWRFNIHR